MDRLSLGTAFLPGVNRFVNSSLSVIFFGFSMSSALFSFFLLGRVAYFSIVLVSETLRFGGGSILAFAVFDSKGAGLLCIEGHLPSSVGVAIGVLVLEGVLAVAGRLWDSFLLTSKLFGTCLLRKQLVLVVVCVFPCSLSKDFNRAELVWDLGVTGGLDLVLSLGEVGLGFASTVTLFLMIWFLLEFLDEELPVIEELSEPLSLVRSPFLSVQSPNREEFRLTKMLKASSKLEQ